MRKKAIIFDLDNTIYPVPQIGSTLFAPLFALIEREGFAVRELEKIKDEMMRTPFQKVAAAHGFSEGLIKECTDILKNLSYNGAIEPFVDFDLVRRLPLAKYLVTTGFTKMQQSKIDHLELKEDFTEIHIIDPSTTSKVKKDVFEDIMQRHGYTKNEVLVIGDDLQSEIKAALELGVEAVWYDKYGRYESREGVKKISHYEDLVNELEAI